ncbi:Uncharacterised protein [Escherichia coli]|uniref:Uncharacterized protein n=1 Tax=Escherichia coli TaxID=562 RepID=A0A485J956_ECOLX|nr:Uncharacterised protein [Escherichia coli]
MSQILLQPANAMITLENVIMVWTIPCFEKYKFNRATGRTDRSVWPFWFR